MDIRQPDLFRPMASASLPRVALLAHCLHASDHMHHLSFIDFSRRHVAMPLWLHLPRTSAAGLPRVPKRAAHGSVLCLRCNGEAARIMKLTPRCIQLFQLLRGARWLFTRQIHRRFFPDASLDAARKWLRKHVETRHLIAYREHRMTETLFTLGPEGKRVLEQVSAGEVRLERKPPKQMAHFAGINDIRIAAELAGALSYFFACWELPTLNWQLPLIPDAVCGFSSGRTFAFEYDRGMEGIRFFVETKIALYNRRLDGLQLAAVVVITDGLQRLKNLAQAVIACRLPMLFSTLDMVQTQGLLAPIFNRNGEHELVRLI
jgi:hypothetical protein